ncbi:efflux RND transporter periplasmic adaptor subunit [bacterium]|nr:efflux RND transporter periplasmic adaptor subunit [bacterium]
MKKQHVLGLVGFLLIAMIFSGCSAISTSSNSDQIMVSGNVEAVEISVAAEVSGKVAEVFVSEGDKVQAGDPLFRLDNEILSAQYDQAVAIVEAAQAGLDSANASVSAAESNLELAHLNLELAQLQEEMTVQASRMAELPAREAVFNGTQPNEVDLPSWYFDRSEEIAALQKEIDEAKTNLEIECQNLEDVLDDVSNADIRAAEERLALAQAAFSVADDLKNRQVEIDGRQAVTDYINSLYDSAKAELESAQAEYDSILSDVGAQDLLEARARVVVANERYQYALTQLYQLQTGEDSLEVQAASLGVAQAEQVVAQAEAALSQAKAGVTAAEKNLAQAQASQNLIQLQLDKLVVRAEVGGVVLAKTIDFGELVQSGITVLTIGQLDDLTITVYVPEEQYGQISLGDLADVSVDSFDGKVFSATVIRIADQAEYTPRNVQTEEDRRTTVFAIELSVTNQDGDLKPGMPADVTFLP